MFHGSYPDSFSQNQRSGGDTSNLVPNTPSQDGPRRKKWIWIVLVSIVIVAIAVVASVTMLNNSPAKAVVQAYYAAVEKQNYTAAYTCLDIQTIAHDGQQYPATQALYIQASQEIDQAKGKVTTYTIIGNELSYDLFAGNTANITVDVTRGGNVQEVDIQLRQIGNKWKIVGIDHF